MWPHQTTPCCRRIVRRGTSILCVLGAGRRRTSSPALQSPHGQRQGFLSAPFILALLCSCLLACIPSRANGFGLSDSPFADDTEGELPEDAMRALQMAAPWTVSARGAGNSGSSVDQREGGYDEHRPRSPPPDLPSLLLDSRIVYIGMPLVPAVTELVVAELLYLKYQDAYKPAYVYVNSTGCSRADGETVGYETEAMAIYDTMNYIGCPVYTVGTGVAIGQACLLLSAGNKGKRFMLPHATAMLHQPRVPSSGQRQATEIQIKWKEVLEQKKVYLDILSKTTGQTEAKLDKDMQRPLYMQPPDALAYGIIDKILKKDTGDKIIDSVKSEGDWDKDAGLRPATRGGR